MEVENCRFHVFCLLITLLCGQIFQVEAQLSYNSRCSESIASSAEQCDQLKGLTCQNGRCRCLDFTQMRYSERTDSCQVFVNGNCSIKIESALEQLPCADPNAECSSAGKCVCNEGHFPERDERKVSPIERCLPNFPFEKCDPGRLPCHESTGLECFRGRCRCQNPASQVFDSENSDDEDSPKRCMGIPGMKKGCDPKISTLENNGCRPNSYCDNNGICHCKPGFITTPGLNPECHLGYKQDCDVAGSSNFCNYKVGLWCFQGKCLCEDEPFVEFDKEKGACARLEGYGCSTTIKLEDETYAPCFTGLECKAVDKTNPLLGVCMPPITWKHNYEDQITNKNITGYKLKV